MSKNGDVEQLEEELRQAVNAMTGIVVALALTLGAIALVIAYFWLHRV